jgi:hypothetical protein
MSQVEAEKKFASLLNQIAPLLQQVPPLLKRLSA